jgi:hypothetical protein
MSWRTAQFNSGYIFDKPANWRSCESLYEKANLALLAGSEFAGEISMVEATTLNKDRSMNRKSGREPLQCMLWMKSASIRFSKFISRKNMNNEIRNDMNQSDSNQNPVAVITASILALALTQDVFHRPIKIHPVMSRKIPSLQ